VETRPPEERSCSKKLETSYWGSRLRTPREKRESTDLLKRCKLAINLEEKKSETRSIAKQKTKVVKGNQAMRQHGTTTGVIRIKLTGEKGGEKE